MGNKERLRCLPAAPASCSQRWRLCSVAGWSLLGSCGAGRPLLGLLSRGLLHWRALLLLLLLFRLGLEWQGWLFCRPCMRLLVWCCWVPA